jgi:hypothetical protein
LQNETRKAFGINVNYFGVIFCVLLVGIGGMSHVDLNKIISNVNIVAMKKPDDKQAELVIGKIPSLVEFTKIHLPTGFKISDVQRKKLEAIVKGAHDDRSRKNDESAAKKS